MKGGQMIKGLEIMDNKILSDIHSHDLNIEKRKPKFTIKWIRESESYIEFQKNNMKLRLFTILIVLEFLLIGALLEIILDKISSLTIGFTLILLVFGFALFSFVIMDVYVYFFMQKYYHIGKGVIRVNQSRMPFSANTDILVDNIISLKKKYIKTHKNQIFFRNRNVYYKNLRSCLYQPNVCLIKFNDVSYGYNPNKKIFTLTHIAVPTHVIEKYIENKYMGVDRLTKILKHSKRQIIHNKNKMKKTKENIS